MARPSSFPSVPRTLRSATALLCAAIAFRSGPEPVAPHLACAADGPTAAPQVAPPNAPKKPTLPVTAPSPTPLRPAAPVDPKAVWKEEDSHDDRWNKTDVGAFLASVVPLPTGAVAKGLSIRLGDRDETSVCYDTATMSLRAAWTDGFLEFDPRRMGIVRNPNVRGTLRHLGPRRAWGAADVRYRALHPNGRRVALWYEVQTTPVFESPSVVAVRTAAATTSNGNETPSAPATASCVLVRSFHVSGHIDEEHVLILDDAGGKLDVVEQDGRRFVRRAGGPDGKGGTVSPVAFALRTGKGNGIGSPPRLEAVDGHVRVVLPTSRFGQKFAVLVRLGASLTDAEFAEFREFAAGSETIEDVQRLSEPGPRRWTETLVTQGRLGTSNGPFAVDTVELPFENPYRALMFLSGHDFLPNGDCFVCTLHGDVWRVRGIGAKLERIAWQRFATGLHQPLGLKAAHDKVHVLGRDQITRLTDRDGDGEADLYENFNNGGSTSTGGHDFAACLETDPQGNFWYIRALEGVCRVSADGRTHESVAKGFRNPVGLGVGPDGTVTAAPQEGNWTPASALFEIRPGGYYGFGGPQPSPQRPAGYDPPLCWIPRVHDNSSGGQAWVTSDRWGPLAGRMLHLSYGQCAVLLVLREHVGGVPQGATVRLPVFCESGILRGRFSPVDGQLWVTGLRGWQTNAAADGCLQRIRRTEAPLDLPLEFRVKPKGLEIVFSEPLDPKSAVDPGNWNVEQWNYKYAETYGSDEWKPSDMRKKGRDEVYVEDVRLAPDGRTVFLELERTVPVMQMEILCAVKTATGRPLRTALYATINAVPGKK